MTPETVRGSPRVPDISPVAKATFGLAVLVSLYAVVGVGSDQGARISDAAGGAFSPSASLLTPAAPAFALWVLIYAGTFGHAVRVWLPKSKAHLRRHRVILPAIGLAVLNTTWIVVALRGYVAATAVVIVVMLGVAWAAMQGLRPVPADDASSWLLMDGTYGLYVGWLLVAVPGNLMAALTVGGWLPGGTVRAAVALTLLTAATVGALVAVRHFAGNLAVPVAFCWGLAWLGRARMQSPLYAPYVSWAAVVAAAVVAASFVMYAPWLPTRRRSVVATTVSPVTSPTGP